MEQRKRIRTLGSLACWPWSAARPGCRGFSRFEMDDRRLGRQRTELLEKGYDFTLDYVGEVAGNLHGGYNDDKTARYSDQFALGAHLDLQKSWLARCRVQAGDHRAQRPQPVQRPHQRPARRQFSSVQEVWGRGQTWRLTQMWIKQKYFDGALDVKFGRFGEGEDFNSFPATSRTWRSAARRWATGSAASGTTGRSASGRCA
jgi:porin